MDRRRFLGALALGASVVPPVAHAQQARVPRVGYLWGGSDGSEPNAVRGFKRGLVELGYSEGKNIVVEYRHGDDLPDQFPALVAGLVARKVDVLLVAGSAMSLAAKAGASAIPIVCATADPVQLGLVHSLANPGGNVTGFTMLPGIATVGKMLDLLKQVAPRASRVAALYDPTNVAQLVYIRGLERAAPRLGIQLTQTEVRQAEDFDQAFMAMQGQGVGAFATGSDPLMVSNRTRITRLAAKHRLPGIYGIRGFVEAGGLLSYGPNVADLWRRVARYMDKILKGAKPATLPVEQPSTFELVINRNTARALRLAVSQSLLSHADEVIE